MPYPDKGRDKRNLSHVMWDMETRMCLPARRTPMTWNVRGLMSCLTRVDARMTVPLVLVLEG